ncbi:MAG: glutamine synthetase [Lachnospiraceae bacterium]|nr:glutamine synthetase [Lachnospiraceae bacterium]
MKTKEDILELVEEEEIEFIRLQFTDMFGNLRNVAVTKSQLNRVLDCKYVFDGSALYGGYKSGEEFYLAPDLDTFVILPWRPQQGKVARFLCDVYNEDGTPCGLSPRTILKKVLKDAKEKGYTFYIDPECEFFLFHTDENGLPTTITHEQAGYMEVGPLDLGENARRDIVLTLEEMGFEVESSHHEKAPAQHEIDFKESEALQIADSIVTFKSAVKSIAKRFGLHATFMPKPKNEVAGSGMHLNISVYKDGRNIFNSKDKEINEEAKHFIGGVMAHAKGLCAITNPLINSYKRICTGIHAPKEITWSEKHGNSCVRVRKRLGEDTKIELRFPDSSANPYLALAVCLAAGMEGMEQGLEAGAPVDGTTKKKEKTKLLPLTLNEAIHYFEKDEMMKKVLGTDFMEIYENEKISEWNEYMEQVSNWEIEKYLYRV